MLSVNQLTFKVKNKTLIDELTLNVTPGSFYALLGRKGSGKTTLLRLCSGLLEPQTLMGWMCQNEKIRKIFFVFWAIWDRRMVIFRVFR